LAILTRDFGRFKAIYHPRVGLQLQLLNFINENNILSTHQSGFRKQHSTETTVVSLVDKILDNMDKQKTTGAVFIDLKKLLTSWTSIACFTNWNIMV
jgi:hypothetical protein